MSLDYPKITSDDLKNIQELHKKILEKWTLENDLRMLLSDWVECLKQNLFFGSISVFTVFIEKYLRDILIRYEFNKNSSIKDLSEHFADLEKIEESIEDWKDETKKRYMFPNICDKLVEAQKMPEHIALKLKEIYEVIRIPVHHWIYWRIVRDNIGKYSVPVKKITIPTEITSEDLLELISNSTKEPLTDSLNSTNPMFRMFIIPDYFKFYSIYLFKAISELVDIIESNE